MTDTPPTAADELRAAADKLRQTAIFRGAMTATPAVAALLRAREPLAELLDRRAAEAAHLLHGLEPEFHNGVLTGEIRDALAVARAVLGTTPNDGSGR